MSKHVTYTADDEIPICTKCDNVDLDDKFCINHCGAKRGWPCYYRTEFIDNGETE